MFPSGAAWARFPRLPFAIVLAFVTAIVVVCVRLNASPLLVCELGPGNSSRSAGRGVAEEDRQAALCVTANPALASHRVDCKVRPSPSEPASGPWVSAWQLAETAVAAWQEALTTAAAAAAAVAAAAVASCVGRERQRSTSQTCRALKALASSLRLSTGARFSGSWLVASVGVFLPLPVFAGK